MSLRAVRPLYVRGEQPIEVIVGAHGGPCRVHGRSTNFVDTSMVFTLSSVMLCEGKGTAFPGSFPCLGTTFEGDSPGVSSPREAHEPKYKLESAVAG
jgi:hypothetical protein